MIYYFENLNYKVLGSVYEPAEDSFLLAKQAKNLKGRILEIGCGTGIVSIYNAKNNQKNQIVALDKNENAIENAKENAIRNKVENITFVKSNLFSKLKKGEVFDYILFNPPYLPTSKDEKIEGRINAAYDGGKDGRKVLDRFLNQFRPFLKRTGSVLLLHSSLNNPKKTIEKLKEIGCETEILEEQSFFFEKLMVLKITKE